MRSQRQNTRRSAAKRAGAVSAASLRELRIKPADEQGNSLVRQAVDSLRKLILSSPEPNRFLGSEDQLMTALGVSRPTFRQAARLLEHEQLLKIKRGIGGGFFAQLPNAEAVSRLASIYLNAQGTTLQQMNDAVAPLLMEAVSLVANNSDAKVRRQLLQFVQHHAVLIEEEHALEDPKNFLRALLEFEQLIGKLARNPAIELMLNVMRDIVRDPRHGHFQMNAARVAVYAKFSRRLAQAVADGDSEMAMVIVKRYIKEVRSWFPEDSVL